MTRAIICLAAILVVPAYGQSTCEPPSAVRHSDDSVCPETAENRTKDEKVPNGSTSPSSRSESDAPNAPSAAEYGGEAGPRFDLKLDEPTKPSREMRRPPIWDKKMYVAQAVLLSSMIFDSEITHEGIAHHRCEEANIEVGRMPSRAELYTDDLEQLGPGVLLGWLGAKASRNGHGPRWLWKSTGYTGAVVGSAFHFTGGALWLSRCW